MEEQTLNQATLSVCLCTSGPFRLLIRSHRSSSLCAAKCPGDDSRSVCRQHLLVLAPACSGPTVPPAFVIWWAGPDATCCTADGRKTRPLVEWVDLRVHPDWEVTDWSLIRGAGSISVLD